MKIIAKRSFISSRTGIGNVPAGRIVDTDDAYAKSLIEAGLAEKYTPNPAFIADKQTSFISPVGATQQTGVSLPADQASQPEIAKKLKSGARKIKGAK